MQAIDQKQARVEQARDNRKDEKKLSKSFISPSVLDVVGLQISSTTSISSTISLDKTTKMFLRLIGEKNKIEDRMINHVSSLRKTITLQQYPMDPISLPGSNQ